MSSKEETRIRETAKEEAEILSLVERLETAGRRLPPLRRQWTTNDEVALAYR
jgi:hypothetical protein